MDSELSDSKFSDKFMSILNSRKDSTYQFAFARFLIDYSRENNSHHVGFGTIAEYFLKYYWVQETRSKLNQTSKKIQKKSNKEKIFLIRQIIHEEFGRKYYPEDYNKIKEKENEKISKCLKKIEKYCFGDVTYAFQNTKDDFFDRPFFNYKIKKMQVRKDRKSEKPVINQDVGIYIFPKAMEFLKRYGVALEKSVILEWARYIEKFNPGIPELIDKIEGNLEKRGNTTKERKILQSIFKTCFYCNDKLNLEKDPNTPKKDPEVEHVIPFSFIREDEIWNFVLSCRKCNCSKLGALPPQYFMNRLYRRNNEYRKSIQELETSLSELGEERKTCEKRIQDHYDNAKSHGYVVLEGFPKFN